MARKSLKPRPPEESPVLLPEDLRGLADDILLMEAYCKAGREFLKAQVERGLTIPGVTLEETTGHRTWDSGALDSEDVANTLLSVCKARKLKFQLDDLAPRSLVSPAQLEKKIGQAAFEDAFSIYVLPPQPTGNYSLKLGAAPPAKKSILVRFKK